MPGMKKNNAQNVSAHTSPHVEHATHKNTGDINYGTITNQTIHGDPNTYVVPHEDLGLLESMSAWIVGKFGEKKPLVIAIISVILGMFQILTDLGNFVPNITTVFPQVPPWFFWVPAQAGSILLIVGILFIALGGFLWRTVEYKKWSKCSACQKPYAKKEIGESTARDVKTIDGIRRTTTRTFECRHCGHTTIEKDSELITK